MIQIHDNLLKKLNGWIIKTNDKESLTISWFFQYQFEIKLMDKKCLKQMVKKQDQDIIDYGLQ